MKKGRRGSGSMNGNGDEMFDLEYRYLFPDVRI